jgi:hypothetical protein
VLGETQGSCCHTLPLLLLGCPFLLLLLGCLLSLLLRQLLRD